MRIHELTDAMKERIDRCSKILRVFPFVELAILIVLYFVFGQDRSIIPVYFILYLLTVAAVWGLCSRIGLRPFGKNYDHFIAVERIIRGKEKKKKYTLYLESVNKTPSNDICTCDQELFDHVSKGDIVLVLCNKSLIFNLGAYPVTHAGDRSEAI